MPITQVAAHREKCKRWQRKSIDDSSKYSPIDEQEEHEADEDQYTSVQSDSISASLRPASISTKVQIKVEPPTVADTH